MNSIKKNKKMIIMEFRRMVSSGGCRVEGADDLE